MPGPAADAGSLAIGAIGPYGPGMEIGVDLIALLMAAAFLAGMIDAVAGGGGLITIPALLAAGIPPVAAIGTNKLQSTFGTLGAVIAFAGKGLIDFRGFALPAAGSFAGSALGACSRRSTPASCPVSSRCC